MIDTFATKKEFLEGVQMASEAMKVVSEALVKRSDKHGTPITEASDMGVMLFSLSCIIDIQEMTMNALAALVAQSLEN